jgi:hypothetical protein
MQIRNFWVDIENASGARLGRGPLRASHWTQTEPLSASGSFSFSVSIQDVNLDALLEKRVAICKYVNQHGALLTFGGGVIDKITRVIAQDGSIEIKVEGNDLTRELTYRSVGTLDLSGVAGAGVLDAPRQIMSLAPSTWSLTSGYTLQSVYAGFDGETVLNALSRVGEHIGEHWRLESTRSITWLGPATSFAASGVRAVQHANQPVSVETSEVIALITGIEEVSDAADLISRVLPRGSGNGGAALTLSAVTDIAPSGYTLNVPANYVMRNDTESTYDRIERVLDFKEIGPLSNTTPDVQAAANMLLQASVEHLRRYGAPQKFYRVSLANVSALLKPGTTIRVVYRKLVDGVVLYDLDDVFNVIEVQKEITPEGIHTSSITISTIDRLPQSDADYLARQSMQGKVLAAHQQLGVNIAPLTFRDEMDDAHGISFRFWLGDEYTSIQRAVLRFRIQPLRSTVKSVAGTSVTTNAGGASTSGSGGATTSGSGGSSTPTSDSSGSHDHQVTATPGSGSALTASGGNLYTGAGTPQYFRTDYVGATHSHSITIGGHTHSVGDHTHTTPDHTHTLTPDILMVYGLFEESSANTLALTNLIIKLNSGADLLASVLDIGNGWYELDLTEAITDEVFRPLQTNNEIAITTALAKTARIEAQITIRGVVQAVAYS